MTIHMLEYFIAVAECQSFTDAAGRCFVSQPALSRAIANLEKEVGCALIDRENRKSVTLTPAGDMMLVEARRDGAPEVRITPPLFLTEKLPGGERPMTARAQRIYDTCSFD